MVSPPPPATPRLTKAASGSGFQFALATLPLLALFIYFLYLAAIRPSLSIYRYQNNQNIQESGAIIPLMDMMGCFLAFLGLFSMLAVYIGVFIPKRRVLMRSYLESGDATLGDVFYDDKRKFATFSKYAYAMYAHPRHPKQWLVRKRIRCFQHYTRERVTILLLPYQPFSGQPKSDIEMDLAASEGSRRDTNKVLYCLIAWIIFLLAAPIFLLHQMSLIEDEYDEPKRGWIIYLVSVLGIIPILAFGGNYLRWRLHRHWVVNRGVVIEMKKPDGGSGVGEVRVAQNDYSMFPCMGYNIMGDEASPVSPTQTEVTQNTAYNSVYMA